MDAGFLQEISVVPDDLDECRFQAVEANRQFGIAYENRYRFIVSTKNGMRTGVGRNTWLHEDSS